MDHQIIIIPVRFYFWTFWTLVAFAVAFPVAFPVALLLALTLATVRNSLKVSSCSARLASDSACQVGFPGDGFCRLIFPKIELKQLKQPL